MIADDLEMFRGVLIVFIFAVVAMGLAIFIHDVIERFRK